MTSCRSIVPAFLIVAGLTVMMLTSAHAGAFRIEPGATTRIDTGERQNYTTITISNPDAAAGRLALDAPINRVVDIPAGGKVELYGLYSRGSVAVTNTGGARLEIVTRYMETWRTP